MCRHLAYLGPPVSLRELLYAPKHGLHTQSYAPREQRHGTVNADGFGVGWYDPGRAAPVRYRRAVPIWADASFADLADVVRSTCVVAAVRSATEGFPVEESGAQPFRADGRLFSHNGVVGDYEAVEAALRAHGVTGVPDVRAPLDSAALLGWAVRAWRSGAPLGEGLASAVAHTAAQATGRYNLLAADGTRLAATACGDTLYLKTASGDDGRPRAVVLASEPTDDAADWRPVPDGSLVVADLEGVEIRPL
ncbi:ergothioneine biosynthesis protein EgtC [Allonocardiopsis opalescens]|uniref:Gamma-glutamyl-hercynylcysteine sulfoxide hydrolase n=1 Tax=Allonocardiopsis opalescens TaxID=1144618 RepID=A0A2T0QE43_9ACTN|nr:ergothioneine biosynthesis protein EgtC [Allonocardiopsis opalescens]PRY02214.1 glutamine amidotransferase [Allonocardiopsis opalescens]